MSNEDDWQIVTTKRERKRILRSKSDASYTHLFNGNSEPSRYFIFSMSDASLGKPKTCTLTPYDGNITKWTKMLWYQTVEDAVVSIQERVKILNFGVSEKICDLWECMHNVLKAKLPENIYNFSNHSDLRLYYFDGKTKVDDHSAMKTLASERRIRIIFHSVDRSFLKITYGDQHLRCVTVQLLHVGFSKFLHMDTSKNVEISPDNRKVLASLLKVKEESAKLDNKREQENLARIRSVLRGMETVVDVASIPKKKKEFPFYVLYTHEQIEAMDDIYECILKLAGAHSGCATIIEPVRVRPNTPSLKSSRIELKTRGNCGFNAYDGDRVLVKVHDHKMSTGKVVSVVQSQHRPVNSVYVCKMSADQTNLMRPLDGCLPKIHVDNEPAKRQYEAEWLKKSHQNEVLSPEQMSELDFDRESNRFANRFYISIFDVIVRQQERHKKIDFLDKAVVHRVDPATCSKQFVVVLESWDPHFMYPQGRVVGMMSSPGAGCYSSRLQDDLPLLSTICHAEPPLEGDANAEKTMESVETTKIKYRYSQDAALHKHTRSQPDVLPSGAVVFTIDDENSKDLDDAISYHWDSTTSQHVVGIHISDVTKYLTPQSHLYARAARQACTFYPPRSSNQKPLHMLPSELATDTLSLNPEQVKPVISVMLRFERDKNLIQRGKPVFYTDHWITSQKRLSYKEVADFIYQDDADDDEVTDLHLALRYTHKIARQLRHRRLPLSYFVQDANEVKIDFKYDDTFDANILVEEFMLLANKSVAECIYSTFPNSSLLRVQPPVQEFDEWVERVYQNTNTDFDSSLNHLMKLLQRNRSSDRKEKPLCMSRKFQDQYVNFINQGQFRQARTMLQFDKHFNEFYVHLLEWYLLNSRSQYICSREGANAHNSHFQLGMNLYTHFTSPIRRFADIMVHRILKLALSHNSNNPADPVIEEPEIVEACRSANCCLRNSRLFEKYCGSYCIQDLDGSTKHGSGGLYCFLLDCAVSEIEVDSLTVQHPRLAQCYSSTKIRFARLGGLQSAPVEASIAAADAGPRLQCRLHWRRIIFSVDPLCRANGQAKRIYNIDPHIYDSQLVAEHATANLFRGIRRSHESADILQEKLTVLCQRFKPSMPRPELISSDSDALSDPIIDVYWPVCVKNTVKVQFCRRVVNGLRKVIPELFVVGPSLQVCLIHQDDPMQCFLPRGQLNLQHTDVMKKFKDIEQYQNYFRPLVQLESLVESVEEHPAFTLLDAPIRFFRAHWPLTNCLETFGRFNLEDTFCRDRNIMFNDESDEIIDRWEYNFEEALQSSGGDLLCMRTMKPGWRNYWVGHGEVLKVGYVQETVGSPSMKVVVFLLTQSDFDLTKALKCREELKFTIEVYMRSVITKRQMEVIDNVHKNDFLKDIILGWERTDVEVDLEMIRSICKKYTLNSNQRQAVTNALSQKLSFIWGPPGTGKTRIGCVLAQVYVEKNRKAKESLQQVQKSYPSSNKTARRPIIVLYCGPSNDSVDLVAREMRNKFLEDCPRILRVFGERQELADFPLPGLLASQSQKKLTGEMRETSLHHLVREQNNDAAESLRRLDRDFDEIIQNRSKPQLGVDIGKVIHDKMKVYKETLKDAKCRLIQSDQFEMVLCTTAVSATKLMREFEVRQVILDEAGMCKEPETLIPVGGTVGDSLRHLVLIGDHKQLRPIVKSGLAGERGLQISLFERYQTLRPNLVTMLNYQYRMHPSICEFPSQNFYKGRLYTQVSQLWSGINMDDMQCPYLAKGQAYRTWNGVDRTVLQNHYKSLLTQTNYNAIPDTDWPGRREISFKCFRPTFDWCPERVMFIHTVGDEESQSITSATGNESSKANMEEVKVVGMVYKKLLARMNPPRQAPSFVTVLTQYRLQEHRIIDRCREVLAELRIRTLQPNVKTVIRSQGSENDYIIFSTVRSLRHSEDINQRPSPGWERKYLGFITDPNQINVALTRAKKGLIIVGNKNLLRVNNMWRKLIDDLTARGCVLENVTEFRIGTT